MNRRRTLQALATAALAGPWLAGLARSQAPARVARVTLVQATERVALTATRKRFVAWFAESGYVDGRNLALTVAAVDYRRNRSGQSDEQVRKVLATRPDVILVPGLARVPLFRRSPPEAPLVFLDAADDAVPRHVADPSRPGGSLTGTAVRGADDMPGKSWELLAELRPGLKRMGDLHSIESGAFEGDLRVQRIGNASVARKLGVEYREIPVSEGREFAAVAHAIQKAGVDAVGVAGHWWTWGKELLEFLERSALPAVFEDPSVVRRGGLLSFRNKDDEALRQGVDMAVRILDGEPPGSLPVRFVERAHVAVNLRTARAIRLVVPPSILARADEVLR